MPTAERSQRKLVLLQAQRSSRRATTPRTKSSRSRRSKNATLLSWERTVRADYAASSSEASRRRCSANPKYRLWLSTDKPTLHSTTLVP
jgi:hypothetical protein